MLCTARNMFWWICGLLASKVIKNLSPASCTGVCCLSSEQRKPLKRVFVLEYVLCTCLQFLKTFWELEAGIPTVWTYLIWYNKNLLYGFQSEQTTGNVINFPSLLIWKGHSIFLCPYGFNSQAFKITLNVNTSTKLKFTKWISWSVVNQQFLFVNFNIFHKSSFLPSKFDEEGILTFEIFVSKNSSSAVSLRRSSKCFS